MFKKAAFLTAALFLLISAGLGQDGRYDVSANGAAVFTKQSDGNGIAQSATNGSNFFATIRLKFRPRHSLAFNYGRSKDSQVYQTGFDFHVLTSITEYTGSYIFTPLKKGRFEPFLLAGGGALVFSPRSTWVVEPNFTNNVPDRIQIDLGAVKQTEIAFLYGAGVDYQLPRFTRFALCLQYRGFLYDAPDFKVTTTSGSSVSFFTGAKGHMAEPSIGLVFRF
jgi:hypothetical protein